MKVERRFTILRKETKEDEIILDFDKAKAFLISHGYGDQELEKAYRERRVDFLYDALLESCGNSHSDLAITLIDHDIELTRWDERGKQIDYDIEFNC